MNKILKGPGDLSSGPFFALSAFYIIAEQIIYCSHDFGLRCLCKSFLSIMMTFEVRICEMRREYLLDINHIIVIIR